MQTVNNIFTTEDTETAEINHERIAVIFLCVPGDLVEVFKNLK